MPPLRLAIVTDIHHGRDTFSKRGTVALPLLERVLAEAEGADAVIDLGDRISDENAAEDRALLAAVAACFQRVAPPRHHICGNHDLAFLTRDENAAILETALDSRSVLVDAVRLLFWQPDVRLTRRRGFHLAPDDLAVLETLLLADDRPTILFSHVPLSGGSMRGNVWFENNPAHAAYAEQDAIRAVLAQAPGPLLCLAGHVHWNSVNVVDGVAHLTQQSLTETFTTAPEAAEAFGMLEIDGHDVRWTVAGHDPIRLDWRLARPPRPIRSLAPFAAAAE
jgi:hypothetical protein